MKSTKIQNITKSFSKHWLGKDGILGVEFDKKGKSIVIYANLNELKYDTIPHVYRGIRTTIKPIEKISTLAS